MTIVTTPKIAAIAEVAIELIQCGLPPRDAIYHACTGERVTDAELQHIEAKVRNADAYNGLRD